MYSLRIEYIANITELEKKDGFELPTSEDLLGASKGLARLQRTYQQETIDVAGGDLMEMNFSSNFTASECFWLGRNLYIAGDLKYAAEWLIQARIRLAEERKESNEVFIGQITDVQILEQLSITMFYLGELLCNSENFILVKFWRFVFKHFQVRASWLCFSLMNFWPKIPTMHMV